MGVGRFTSADTMVRMIRDGVLDMIGAARPSIADPFLPRKIEEGRWEDICECIGCNICVSGEVPPSHRSGARRTQPWARSGDVAGTPSGCARQRL